MEGSARTARRGRSPADRSVLPDLEIRQLGRGIMVRVRAPWFSDWWHEDVTWEGDPIGPIYEWLREERGAK